MPQAVFNQPFEQPHFQTTSPAKCILMGEHAVLRGYPALVVPLTSYSVTLQYWQTNQPLSYSAAGPGIIPERLPFIEFSHHIADYLSQQPAVMNPTICTGHFHWQLTSPVASGLGSSAGMAVAMARWCYWRSYINPCDLFQYAHNFEHFFHGTSSGIDVMAVLHQQPFIYKMGQPPVFIEPQWSPMIYLSATGQLSNTRQALAKVAALNVAQTDCGQAIDEQMAQSVELMHQGLTTEPQHGIKLIRQAFDIGYDCHQAWGLNNNPQVQQHYANLRAQGAVALKPTGAGDGGHVLSLWHNPPRNHSIQMVKVF